MKVLKAPSLPIHRRKARQPAGGRQGTGFQIAVGGQYLDGVTNVYVSGAGVVATVVEFNKPMTQRQINLLRDQSKELQERKAASRNSGTRGRPATSQDSTNVWTAADEKALVEHREKLAKNPPNRFGNPAIAETATRQVTAVFMGMGMLAFWSQGRWVPILLGCLALTLFLCARRLSFSRQWFAVGRVLDNSLEMRREVQYAVTLIRWFELEGERADSVAALWQDFRRSISSPRPGRALASQPKVPGGYS